MQSKKNSDDAVCARIRQLTWNKGWTNAELSRRSDVSYRAIYNCMQLASRPRDKTLARIAEALGVSVADLERDDLPVEKIAVREAKPEYEAMPPGDLPPLHAVVDMLAKHLNLRVDDVMEAVLEKMNRNKREGGP